MPTGEVVSANKVKTGLRTDGLERLPQGTGQIVRAPQEKSIPPTKSKPGGDRTGSKGPEERVSPTVNVDAMSSLPRYLTCANPDLWGQVRHRGQIPVTTEESA